jgi:hypothetical protein
MTFAVDRKEVLGMKEYIATRWVISTLPEVLVSECTADSGRQRADRELRRRLHTMRPCV